MNAARLLETRMVEKVWGRDSLPAPFAAPDGKRIGEIWFEPPPELGSLLVKYLFTSEKLSVQVHPSDADARDGEDGKEECWLVLDTEPGASLAIGFREPVSPKRMRAAALDGSIEQLLDWHEAAPGDFFYLRAGTVHAIGPGITLVEVQQNSDTTFRLYDYGRPRELHLGRALDVASGAAFDPASTLRVTQGSQRLVDGPKFRFDRITGQISAELAVNYGSGPALMLPLKGDAIVAGLTVPAGACALIDDVGAVELRADGITLLASPA